MALEITKNNERVKVNIYWRKKYEQ